MQMGKRKQGAAHLAPAALSTAVIPRFSDISKGVPILPLYISIFEIDTTGEQPKNNQKNAPGQYVDVCVKFHE